MNELRYLEQQILTDTSNNDTVASEAWVTTVASNGMVRRGVHAGILGDCCFDWAMGPDGVAYGSDTSSTRAGRPSSHRG